MRPFTIVLCYELYHRDVFPRRFPKEGQSKIYNIVYMIWIKTVSFSISGSCTNFTFFFTIFVATKIKLFRETNNFFFFFFVMPHALLRYYVIETTYSKTLFTLLLLVWRTGTRSKACRWWRRKTWSWRILSNPSKTRNPYFSGTLSTVSDYLLPWNLRSWPREPSPAENNVGFID